MSQGCESRDETWEETDAQVGRPKTQKEKNAQGVFSLCGLQSYFSQQLQEASKQAVGFLVLLPWMVVTTQAAVFPSHP